MAAAVNGTVMAGEGRRFRVGCRLLLLLLLLLPLLLLVPKAIGIGAVGASIVGRGDPGVGSIALGVRVWTFWSAQDDNVSQTDSG